MDDVERDELANCIRAWRDRLEPADVGLPAGGRRRARGLRREEVAQLTGVSVDYLARLEQGRATSPSPQVLDALARTLRLTDAERAHLHRVAGHALASTGRMNRHVTPSVQRILDRLADTPVMVVDAAWHIVAWNAMAGALLGDFSAMDERERNIAWQFFTGRPSRVVRDDADAARMGAEIVASLHDAFGRHPNDSLLRDLIADLRAASERFEALWQRHPVARHVASRKTIDHPQVGPITLDCDVLRVAGTDLDLVVYTAEPGTSQASTLAMVGALGLQSFAPRP
jgi:transcriptional regulator with XRE-family HTH domain